MIPVVPIATQSQLLGFILSIAVSLTMIDLNLKGVIMTSHPSPPRYVHYNVA